MKETPIYIPFTMAQCIVMQYALHYETMRVRALRDGAVAGEQPAFNRDLDNIRAVDRLIKKFVRAATQLNFGKIEVVNPDNSKG